MSTEMQISKSKLPCRCCGQKLEQRTRPEHVQIASDGRTRIVRESSVLLCTNINCAATAVSYMLDDYLTFDLSPFIRRGLRQDDTQAGGGGF